MFRIWAKIINTDKIILSRIFEFEGAYKKSEFYGYLTHICQMIDLPVPIILKKHTLHFEKFNNTRFLSSDFVEPISFSSFLIENVSATEKKPKNLDFYI